MGYIEKLAEITTKELNDSDAYCISDRNDKIIVGDAACEFEVRPCKDGGWRVMNLELGVVLFTKIITFLPSVKPVSSLSR